MYTTIEHVKMLARKIGCSINWGITHLKIKHPWLFKIMILFKTSIIIVFECCTSDSDYNLVQ